jgi:hypothetical protein
LAAKFALLPHLPTVPGQEDPTITQIGVVRRFDSRTMSGVVAFGDALELPFPTGAVIKSGVTTLSVGQSLQCRIARRADGSMVVVEVELSVDARAAKLNELARQAEAAEGRYRLFNRVPRN